ncbi:MAG: DUF1192 domain-containing protein [Filomicrobium sp.]
MDWDEPQKQTSEAKLGEDLSNLGLEELEARVSALRAEIVRVEEELGRKKAQKEAAASLFKD